MADKKISQLTAATLPLAGTEVLPIVQSNTTVKVATDNLTVKNVRSNATTGILQVVGPTASQTRVMTVPDANFTAARTDAGQTFTGNQIVSGTVKADRLFSLEDSNTITNGSSQTLFTLTTGDCYIVSCSFANFSGGTTNAIVWLPESGNTSYSAAVILGQNFSTFTLSVSGANVQITNTVGASVTYYWSAIRLH